MGVIRLLRRLLRLGIFVLALTIAAVLYAEHRIRHDGALAEALPEPVDAAIVLGAGVDGDGRLGYDSRRRVAGGVALLADGRAAILIFSGGVGGNHPTTPAAVLMRDHAVELGADRARLMVEPRAVSTFENLRFSFAIAREQGFERLAIVSDPGHLARAAALASFWGKPGLPLVAVPGTERGWWPIRGVFAVREALAWWFNLGKVAGWEAFGLIGMPEARREELIR